MQFKKQGNKVQVLAYRGYDAIKKRSIIQMMGSIDAYSLKTSTGLIDKLTSSEKRELDAAIADIKKQNHERGLQYALDAAIADIKKITEALNSDSVSLVDFDNDLLLAAVAELKKSMRKAKATDNDIFKR